MTDPIRWGVMGAARIARLSVCPAIQQAEGAVLAALATRDPARAAPFLARCPGLRVHASYEALLDDPEIEAVYIPLPNHLHVEWTERALAAGKHVLCEKPLAPRAADVDRLIAARDASGRLAAEGFMVLHHPQWHRVRTLLAEGAVGRLAHVEGAFTYAGLTPGNIRLDPAADGGALLDIGVYPSAVTRFVTGQEPLRCRSLIRRTGGVDTFARVWADFPDFTMSFHVGMELWSRQEMVFHGERGFLRLPAAFRDDFWGCGRIEWQRDDGTQQVEIFPRTDQFVLMVENFGRSLREGVPFVCPLEFSRGNAAMIETVFAGEIA